MRRLLPLLVLLGCQDYTFHGHSGDNDHGAGDTDPDVSAGPQPDIEVTPSELHFGGRPVGCDTDPQAITVKNVGDADLSIDDIEVFGEGSASFTITDVDAAPSTVAPGDSFELHVVFAPAALNDYTVPLRISSNDPDEAQSDVPLDGTGSEDAMNEEHFTQNAPSKVDVLWIVDNSGSMSEEVGALQDSFHVFIESFVNLGLDYHIAVTTTDMYAADQSGRFQGYEPIITSALSQGDAITAFADATDLGSGGSGDEKGLDASYAALTEPLLSGENAGFYRADAVLSVIILSDENDHSDISKGAYSQWLNQLKGDPDLTALSGVVGAHSIDAFHPGGCFTFGPPPREAEAGDIYIDVATNTGGMYGDICDLNFDSVVQYLSYNAAGLVREFQLSDTPSSFADMIVTVNGVEVPYNGANGWTWDAATNSVQFNGDAIPGPNDTIVVQYPVPSTCN